MRVDGTVETTLETLLTADKNEFDARLGRIVATSADGEAERLQRPWSRARIRPDEVRANSETLRRVTSRLGCEFIDSQSEAGGASGAAVKTMVTGCEMPSLELRLSAKMLRRVAGVASLLMGVIAGSQRSAGQAIIGGDGGASERRADWRITGSFARERGILKTATAQQALASKGHTLLPLPKGTRRLRP
jgi:hypothetical protein